jgi:ribosomal protein L11 methyltransferase
MHTWPALDIQQADDDDLVQAFLIDFNLAAVQDSRFFFHRVDDRDRAAVALRAHFAAIDVHVFDVPDDDWAARSQAALRAVQIGNIVVAPPWDVPDQLKPASTSSYLPGRLKPAPPSSYVGAGFRQPAIVVIQPSMGFGTGHHATTRLCLAAMQQIDLRGRSVIDVGTGSGVLAIAARRLGASGVLAIDEDPDAIAAAEANARLNEESRIALEIGDFRASKIGQFDIVLANLTGGVLVAAADRLQSFAAPGGRLVLSGFLAQEEQDVRAAFNQLAVESRTHEDEWMCMTIAR